ncbi:MAG: ABC transporter permease [Gemmatimonadota bacterium]|nr:MAG: ABC transporter permease [Gemmatimonadota bacterium]
MARLLRFTRAQLFEATELLLDGCRAILAHKLRSLLTLTGIVFGVASLVAMFSIVTAIKAMVREDYDRWGLKDTFEFDARSVEAETAADRASKGLRSPEADTLIALESVVDGTDGVFGEQIAYARLEPRRYPVVGTGPEYLEIRRLEVVSGRSLTPLDLAERAPVAVLGARAARELFGDADPLGREFRLGGERFRAAGVVRAPRMTLIPASFEFMERRVYIPVTTYQSRFTGAKSVHAIVLRAPSYEAVGPAINDAESKLLQLHRGVRDFEIDNNAAEYAEDMVMVDGILFGWNVVLGAIAVISLLIGGIGLFSILQVSVRERVREIGIRKSVGADDSDIRREFLAESLTLAAFGGVLGILMGSGLCLSAESIAAVFGRDWSIPISPLGAISGFVFSITVGVGFGIYPAKRAAALDPVTAILQ